MADVAPTDPETDGIDRYLARAVPFGFAGSVLVATGGAVRLAQGYGWADRDGRRPNTSATVFSLGSITKPLTATAVLALVEQGRIGLTDTLPAHLDRVPDDKAAITVEQVLSHTAGLPDATGEDFDLGGRADVLRTIFETPLTFEPGSAYAYSNAGYSVLAAVIEEVTGRPYEDALRGLVLEPAGMTRTGYRLPAWDRSELAHFYVAGTDVGVHIDKTFPNWHIMGNGEMLSTVHDLHRFTRALQEGRIIGQTWLADAWRPRHGDYGLGWSYGQGAHGAVVQHDGASTNGVSALLRWYRDSDTVLALLCNRDYSGGTLIHAVGPQIEALLFGGSAPMPPALSATGSPARAALAGTYVSDGGDVAEIRLTADGPAITVRGQRLLDLVSGRSADADLESRAHVSLDMLRALLSGDDAPLLAALDGNRDRLERYRQFIRARLGGDADRIEVEGSVPAEISIGRVDAVQLGVPGPSAESTLRLFWNGSALVGLGYGTRPLVDLPLVAVSATAWVTYHLGLGASTAWEFGSDGLLTARAETGGPVELRRVEPAGVPSPLQ